MLAVDYERGKDEVDDRRRKEWLGKDVKIGRKWEPRGFGLGAWFEVGGPSGVEPRNTGHSLSQTPILVTCSIHVIR